MSRSRKRLQRRIDKREAILKAHAERRGFQQTVDTSKEWSLGKPILPIQVVPRPFR